MNPATQSAKHLRALLIALGFAVVSATAQTSEAPATKPVPATTEEDSENTPEEDTTVPATKIIKLESVEVLGSRIRHTEIEGPSPVSTYDTDYIRATGALTLADFMKTLPQNYTGVPSGRASAPNEMNPESGLFSESSTPSFNFNTGSFAIPFGQTGVSGASLRGLGSGSTLVLVDGRRVTQSAAGNGSSFTQQGFVDLNTIPLGMVERIEMITDGASALYGADAVGGVINVILKKNWNGTELTGSFKGAEHDGGRERSLSLTHGFSSGPLRGTVNINYYDRADLKASQRSFTKNQNHTQIVAGHNASGAPVYGLDRRLNWGYPPVVQARTGFLAGITDPNGNPTRFAVLKNGAAGTSLSDFTGVTANFASGIQRGNTAEYLDLISPSERYGVSGSLNYTINSRLEAYAKYYFTDSRSLADGQPGTASAATTTGFGSYATVVPGAYNAFGQDIAVGMIYPGFGSQWQTSHTDAHNGVVGLIGSLGDTWVWDASYNYQTQDLRYLTRVFNGAALPAALSNPDASLRINPFASAAQSAVYEQLATYPSSLGKVKSGTWSVDASGELFDIWSGPVQLAVGATHTTNKNDNTVTSYSTAPTPVKTTRNVSGERSSYAVYSEFLVPLVSKEQDIPLVRRFDVQLAGRYEDQDDAGDTTVPKVGFAWVPVETLLFRASYSKGFRAPALTELQVSNSTSNSTLLDPRRGGVSTTGIATTRGSNPDIEPETSSTETYGVVYEPAFAKGLILKATYYRTQQNDLIQQLTAQTIVNNEAIFGDRITRAAPDASDLALNQPGRITAVDITFDNYGTVRNHSLDLTAEYRLPWEDLGQWRVNFTASRMLESTREFVPGVAAIDDSGDTNAAPKWNFVTSLLWNKGPWSASAFTYYISGFNTNKGGNIWTNNNSIVSSLYPEMWRTDMNVGYEFKQGLWRGYGKGLRVQIGVGNVFDKEPPFADNIYGYNGALYSQWVYGRSYELSFSLPF
ncbi:MAG: TonB-dependent receptor [Opitutaceae bacterium]|nr:TonB-dependent receptor [Opitutaceae bacterium]